MRENAFKIDFVGIGPPKAGTTWLGHMLDAHPQICLSEPKEVHFFNDSLSFNRSYDRTHFPLGIEWYSMHFKHCKTGQLKGEVTPRYILDPVVPGRLFHHNPDLKLIVCLRNPCQRIVSHYHSARDYHHHEPRTLSQAIREEPEYIDACRYYNNASRFFPYFPMDRFFFLDMDFVKINPTEQLRRLYTFLGVDSSFLPKHFNTPSNPARTTRSVYARKWTGALHRSLVSMGLSPFIRTLKKVGVGKWINYINSAPLVKAQLTHEDRVYILNAIREDVLSLGQLLNRDYSSWLNESDDH